MVILTNMEPDAATLQFNMKITRTIFMMTIFIINTGTM